MMWRWKGVVETKSRQGPNIDFLAEKYHDTLPHSRSRWLPLRSIHQGHLWPPKATISSHWTPIKPDSVNLREIETALHIRENDS